MKTIVEVGAHEGTETLKFLEDAEANVYAFEPDWLKFQALYKRSLQYPRLTVLPFAVDIGDNQEPLFDFSEGQSTLQPPWGNPSASFRMVWTMRLDSFIHLYSIEQIDYLRIDAPYREEMCLESLGQYVNRVHRGRVCVYDTAPAVTAVPTYLYDNGFNFQLDTSTEFGKPDIRFWR